MAGMGLRHLFCVGAAALALTACGTGTPGNVAQNGQASVMPPASATPPTQATHLLVGFENGECRLSWNGRAVNGQGLLDAAVAELEAAIRRGGGPSAATVDMLTIPIAASLEAPWRCVGGAIHQLRRAGYARLVLGMPGDPTQRQKLPIMIDLPIGTDAPPPPIEPETNRIAVANNGAIRWNSAAAQPDALLAYLQASQRVVPVPRLDVAIDGEASFATAFGVLDIVRRAGILVGPGADLPPPEEPIAPPGFGTPPSVVTEVPPPGDGFELIGLERFVPDLR